MLAEIQATERDGDNNYSELLAIESAAGKQSSSGVADAAKGSADITSNISGVASAAQGTSTSAQESQKAANDLADMAAQLRGLVEQFKISSRDRPVLEAASPTARTKAMGAGAGR